MEKVRADKWLWMVRLFKTRTMATDACNAGKVKIEDVNVKPSRELHEGCKITVKTGQLKKEVVVLNSPKSRISAKDVPLYYEDITPPEEYERVKMLRMKFETREAGLGRPTKRDRRQLDYLKDFLNDEDDWDDEISTNNTDNN